MKIKQHLLITNPADFLKGHYECCFNLMKYPGKYLPKDWIICGEIEFDVEVDTGEVIQKVVSVMDREIEKASEEFALKMHLLKRRKEEFLALAAPIGDES